jgi:membrane protein DedA with SNARE-associated domain
LQLAMIAAGASGYPLGWYLVAIAISRVLRYFGIAWLVLRFGDRAEAMLREYKWKAVTILSGCIVIIWLGRTYLFN